MIISYGIILIFSSIAECTEDPLELKWASAFSIKDDFETVKYPQSSVDFMQWSCSGTVSSTGRNYTIHVGSLSTELPSGFSFQLPEGGKL